MAKEGNAAPVAAAPKKNMLMVVLVLVVAVAIGVGAAMMMGGGKKKHRKVESDGENIPAVVFKDEFIVNLASADGVSHYMRVPRLELAVDNADVVTKIEENRSKIGDRISSTLRSKTYEEMKEVGSDVKLKADLKKVINKSLGYDEDSHDGVREVLLPLSLVAQ